MLNLEVSRPKTVIPLSLPGQSANFSFNLSVKVVKVYAHENPYKNGEVLVVFWREKTSEIRQAGIINRR